VFVAMVPAGCDSAARFRRAGVLLVDVGRTDGESGENPGRSRHCKRRATDHFATVFLNKHGKAVWSAKPCEKIAQGLRVVSQDTCPRDFIMPCTLFAH